MALQHEKWRGAVFMYGWSPCPRRRLPRARLAPLRSCMSDSADPAPVPSTSAPSPNTCTNGNTARKRGKEAAEKRDSAARLHVLDSHMRLNFLHQGALHLSSQSSGLDDGYAKLARRYAKLFRDVLKTERVKIRPDIGQTFCRKCKQVFVAKVERCTLTLVQRKVIQRKCNLCGSTRNYEWNANHLSRNEKYWKDLESNSAEATAL